MNIPLTKLRDFTRLLKIYGEIVSVPYPRNRFNI